jgi:hypothetical protein
MGFFFYTRQGWPWQSNGFSPPPPPGNSQQPVDAARPSRPGALPPQPGGRPGHHALPFATRIEEVPHGASCSAGAAPPTHPHNHHPGQRTSERPAAHTAFYTHWARLVSNMGQRPPHLGVLARFPLFTTCKAIFRRRGSARVAHGPIFVFRTSQLLHSTRIGHN